MNYQASKSGGDTAVLTEAPPKRRGAQVARVTLLTLMVVGLAVWAADWTRNALLYVHETDARISADMVSISSRVAGWVMARNVGMGSEVAMGDVLAVIDSRDAHARLVELEAEINRLEAERAELSAEIAMVDGQTRSRISSENARLSASQALVETIVYEFDYAERELARAQQLSESGVIPVKVYDEARTDYLTTQKELLRARALVATAEARVGEAEAARREITMLKRERETLEYRKFEVQTRIERQKLDIADRTITSPINAVVSRAFVEV
ncbi:MAG: biotin/lipoyl-binding protein, partial [Alphaproteobacteria bacterium]